MNINDIKDSELKALIDDAVANGYLSEDLTLTDKRIPNANQFHAYSSHVVTTYTEPSTFFSKLKAIDTKKFKYFLLITLAALFLISTHTPILRVLKTIF